MEIVIVRGKTNGKRLSKEYLSVCRSVGLLVGWLVGPSVIISKTGGKLQFRASTRALVWLAVTFFTIIWKVHEDYYSITIWSFLAIMIHNTYPRRERFLKHFYLVTFHRSKIKINVLEVIKTYLLLSNKGVVLITTFAFKKCFQTQNLQHS